MRFQRFLIGLLAVFAVALSTMVGAQRTDSPDVLLRQAADKVVMDGDLNAAIELYQTIVSRFAKTNPAAAATALLGLADCYQKQGNAQAQTTLERLVRDFGSQTAQVAEARTRLAALGRQATPGTGVGQVCAGADCIFDLASISRDGRWIATGAGSLVVHDMTTGTRVTLVRTVQDALGDVENALISPDGKTIAFTWCCETPNADRSSLRVISNQAGASPRPLLQSQQGTWPRAVAWSADGSRVLAIVGKQDWSSELAWVSVATGAVVVVTTRPPESPLRDASLSPDGRFIAFSTGPQRSSDSAKTARQLYVIDAAGTGRARLISSGSSADNNPVWTANGGHLLYTSDHAATSDLWAMPMRDGAPAGEAIRVKADMGSMWPVGVTRDGVFYYYQRRPRLERILVLDLDTTGRLPAKPRLRESFVGRNPSWSPDGKQLAFEKPPASSSRADMVVHSFDSGAERMYSLTLPAMTARGPNYGRAPSRSLWLADSSGFLQQFEKDDGAVPGDREVNYAWFRLDLNRAAFEPLPGLDRVVVAGEGHSIGWRRPLAPTPDGRSAYIFKPERDQSPRIVTIDLETGNERPIFVLPKPSNVWPAGLALSRDGRTLALAWNDGGATVFATVAADGTGFREIGKHSPEMTAGQIAWTRDGRALLFARRPADGVCRLMRISATGGQAEFAGFEMESPSICRFAVSPIDSRVAMAISENASELWAIDVSEAALVKRTR